MSTQLDLFGAAKVKVDVEKPEPRTKIRVGSRIAEVNLGEKRREALAKFFALLEELEGKDIWLGTCGGSGSHFWTRNLKLERLQVQKTDGVIVLWGRKEASVRIFTERVISLREQQYSGYTLWLLDFWNGFGEYPIDRYRPIGYVSLEIVRFKD